MATTHCRLAFAVALVLAASCKESDSSGTETASPEGETGEPTEPKDPDPATDSDEPADPSEPTPSGTPKPPEPAMSPVEGVPAIAAESPSKEATASAVTLNKEGLALHRAKKYDEAQARYTEALKADPSHPFARYNLASLFVTKGEPDKGMALLGEFRELGCSVCFERLRRARQDGEWKPLWKDPVFVTLTDVGEGPTSQVIAFSIGQSEDPASQGGEALKVLLEPPPGWARAPDLEFVIENRRKQTKIVRKGKTIESNFVSEVFEPPQTAFRVTLMVDGKTFGTLDTSYVDMRRQDFPSIVRKVKRPRKVARCNGLECPAFPALSPDGAILVDREPAHLVSPGDKCNPPTSPVTAYVRLFGTDGADDTGSRDLAGYEILDCNDAALQDGFTAERAEDVVVIKDPSGGQVATIETGGSSGNDICVSKKHRIVVVKMSEGLGGDCQEVTRYFYAAARY